MKPRPFQRPAQAERPKQEVPVEITNDLLGVIRGQFYGDLPPKQWFQDQHFLKRNCVLWFATWLDDKAMTLPPQRYKEVFMEAFDKIKMNTDLSKVKCMPRYITFVVQDHVRFHADEITSEAKRISTKVDVAMMAVQRTCTDAPAVDPIRAMAQARAILVAGKRTRRAAPQAATKQGELPL